MIPQQFEYNIQVMSGIDKGEGNSSGSQDGSAATLSIQSGAQSESGPLHPQNNNLCQAETQPVTIQVEKLLSHMKIQPQASSPEKESESEGSNQEKYPKQSQNQLNDTKYFVEISKPNVAFGRNALFPGSIQQVDVSIGLKEDSLSESQNNDAFMLGVIAKCSNPEFDALDEYVFSVRSNDRFQYFEEVRFKIRKNQRAQVKVAVKIPPLRDNYLLTGLLQIQLEGLKPVCLPITAKCEIPQIICMKDLYKADEECSMIKIPAKKNQIRMPPIPFKNASAFNFTLEVETLSNQNFANRAYDVISQNFVNCQASMQFFVNLQLKQNINYKSTLPLKDTIRKILVLKIKNSSVHFNFPIEINVYEGPNASGMS